MDHIACWLSTAFDRKYFMRPQTTFKVRFPSSRDDDYADLRSPWVWHRVVLYTGMLVQIGPRALFMSQSVIFKTINYSLISSVNFLVHGLSSNLVTPPSLTIDLPMLLPVWCEKQSVGFCMIFHLINIYYLFLYNIHSYFCNLVHCWASFLLFCCLNLSDLFRPFFISITFMNSELLCFPLLLTFDSWH